MCTRCQTSRTPLSRSAMSARHLYVAWGPDKVVFIVPVSKARAGASTRDSYPAAFLHDLRDGTTLDNAEEQILSGVVHRKVAMRLTRVPAKGRYAYDDVSPERIIKRACSMHEALHSVTWSSCSKSESLDVRRRRGRSLSMPSVSGRPVCEDRMESLADSSD